MWKVYCDDDLIYDTKIELLKLANAVLELELNKTGSFTFTIYPSHPYYNKLQKMKSIIKVYCDDYLIFRGRILNDTLLFYNQKQVVCEGELAFLIDSRQRPYDFQNDDKSTTIKDFFTYLINQHNSQVEATKQFKVGNISVVDANNKIVRADSTYLNTWESLNQKLLEINEGYLWVRHEADGNYIDYLKDFDTISNQTIEFGKNLLDFNKATKGEELATAIIPLGAQEEGEEERLNIKSVNNDLDYIYNQEAVNVYGWIYKVVEWDDVTEPANLKTKAEEYLKNSINLVVSLELSAIDLANVNKDFNSFRLGTYVKVISKPHNLDSKFLITKLSIDLLNPANSKLALGKSYSTFTEQSSMSSSSQKVINNEVKGMKNQSVTKRQLNDAIIETQEQNSSSISQSADEILLKVSEDYFLKDNADALVETINTELSVTNEAVEVRFNQFSQDIEAVANGADAQFQEINKYIRFQDGNIILGEEGNELVLTIQNDRISFLQNDLEVAYFSNRKLFVLDGEFIESLTIGKFAFLPRSNGNLSFKMIK